MEKNTKVQEVTAVVLGTPHQSDGSIYITFKTEWTNERQGLCIIFDAILKWCESVKRYSELSA